MKGKQRDRTEKKMEREKKGEEMSTKAECKKRRYGGKGGREKELSSKKEKKKK